jgi:hypothetical protein
MTIRRQHSKLEKVLEALLQTFCQEIVECDGLLLLSTAQVRASGWDGLGDPVSIEATMNKRYLSELIGDAISASSRADLMRYGRAIIQIWSERIALRFPDRVVVFYLGGSESVLVRFHARRLGVPDWADLADRAFLSASLIEVFELRNGNLNKVH